MEEEVRARFERIESVLEAVVSAQRELTAAQREMTVSQKDAITRMDKFERQLRSTRNLVHVGIRMMVDMQQKIDGLIDSETRLYGAIQELAEVQKVTGQKLQAFIDSLQKRSDGRPTGKRK